MTTVLDEAANIIDGARNETYGDAADEFVNVAKAWSAYLDHEITPLDYANLMIILKVMRARHGWYRDSYVDTCGYAALAERVNDKAEGKDEAKLAPLDLSVSVEPFNPKGWLQSINETEWTITGHRYADGGPVGTISSGLLTPPETAVSLTPALRDWQWQSTLYWELIYMFSEGQWWYRNPKDDAEDPWVKSTYGDGDVSAFEGPFSLFTG